MEKVKIEQDEHYLLSDQADLQEFVGQEKIHDAFLPYQYPCIARKIYTKEGVSSVFFLDLDDLEILTHKLKNLVNSCDCGNH